MTTSRRQRHPMPPVETAAASPLAPWLRGALFLAAVSVLALPAARGHSVVFGLVPLWLLGMPLASLLALAVAREVESRLPRRHAAVSFPAPQQRRRPAMPQARRRNGGIAPDRLTRVA